MNDTKSTKVPEEKPGFFRRLFEKVDKAMKEKADEKADQGCCCSSESKDKGDKCC